SQILIGLREANSTSELRLNHNNFGSLEEGMVDCYKFTENKREGNNDYIFYGNTFRNSITMYVVDNPQNLKNPIVNAVFDYDTTLKLSYEQLENRYLCLM